jgi:hypothetical protein
MKTYLIAILGICLLSLAVLIVGIPLKYILAFWIFVFGCFAIARSLEKIVEG